MAYDRTHGDEHDVESQMVELRLQNQQNAGEDHQHDEAVIHLAHTNLVLIAGDHEMDGTQQEQENKEGYEQEMLQVQY